MGIYYSGVVAAVGDLHVGRGRPECRPEVAGRLLTAVARDAAAAGAQALVVTGDLCDRRASWAEQELAVRALEAVAERLPVVLVWGNHDVACGVSRRTVIDGVHLAAKTPEVFEFDGFDIAAVSVERDRDPRTVMDGFPEPVRPTLGLMHSGLTDRRASVCLPTTAETLAATGYDGWALGHVHRRMQVQADPPVWYAGTHWKKSAEPGFVLFDLARRHAEAKVVEL